MKIYITRIAAALCCHLLFIHACLAQTVINVPPNSIPDNGTVPGDSQVNVFEGGNFGSDVFLPFQNTEINLFGGEIGERLRADFGSNTINVLGGEIGDQMEIGSNSIVNVQGGSIGSSLDSFSGGTINVSDGIIGRNMDVRDVQLNVTGGFIDDNAEIDGFYTSIDISGGVIGTGWLVVDGNLNISGGQIGSGFRFFGSSSFISGGEFASNCLIRNGVFSGGSFADGVDFNGSNVLRGGEFLLNGQPVSGNISIAPDDSNTLSGTFENGQVFVFRGNDEDDLSNIGLQSVALPTYGTETIVLQTEADVPPPGLRQLQTLVIQGTGAVGNDFAATGATLVLDGGSAGDNLECVDTQVVILDGSTGDEVDFVGGSNISMSGGAVGRQMVLEDAVFQMSGGFVDSSTEVNSNSNFSLSGGTVGGFIFVNDGGYVDITGGIVFGVLFVQAGSEVHFSGGRQDRIDVSGDALGSVSLYGAEFLLNGVEPSAATVTLFEDDVLSGTYVDGTPFVFSKQANDDLFDAPLIVSSVPPADLTPIVVGDPTDEAPLGLRSGQSLTVRDTGSLGDIFVAVGATLFIEEGGSVGIGAKLFDTEVQFSGGSVGNGLRIFRGTEFNMTGGNLGTGRAYDGSTVHLAGGTVGNQFEARAGSRVYVTGSSAGQFFWAMEGSEVFVSGGSLGVSSRASADSYVEISGGFIGADFEAREGSQIVISGGGGRQRFNAFAGSEINIIGTDFTLDGVPIEGLSPGSQMVIDQRDVDLEGVLADGTSFEFDLRPSNGGFSDYFDPEATVTIQLPDKEVLLGDLNGDGEVSLLDVAPFVAAIQAGTFVPEADINGDFVVDLLDVALFIDLLSG